MNMTSITGTVMLLLLVSILAGKQQQTVGPKNSAEEILSRRVGWTNPQSSEVFFVLPLDLHTARLPGGVFAVRRCGELQPEFVPAEDSTLQNELNRIAKIMPDYQWAFDDGVFNFLPKNYAPSPLDIPIAEFEADNVTAIEAYNQLYDRPEVKSGFASLGLHEPEVGIVVGIISQVKDQKHISIKLKSCTLRQALNAIVKADGSKVWMLSVYSCNGDSTYQYTLMN